MPMLKIIYGVTGIGAIAYGFLCTNLWLWQTRLIFHPQPAPATTPADAGLTYEDVWISVPEGRLHGWWIPSRDAEAKTVLVLHGNASNVENALWLARDFLSIGLSVLVVDYRGYGLSSGPFPNEARVYEDAAAAWNHLTETRNISPEDIIIFGHSIGGAIAIELATHQPEAAGLIVQSTFTSMYAMMDVAGYSRIVPRRLLNQRFNSFEKLAHLQVPTFFIHGDADVTVPPSMSRELYDAYQGPKHLWMVPDAGHNNIAEIAREEYPHQLQQWLQNLSRVDSTAGAVS